MFVCNQQTCQHEIRIYCYIKSLLILGPRRHITINYPDHFGSENDKNGLSTSLGKTLSPTGENEKKKRPTIIKYSGQGKEVYVCGNNFKLKLKIKSS